MSPQLISLAAKVFERVAPFYILWDLADQVNLISDPLRRYWKIPDDVRMGKIFLERPFRGELRPEHFPELTEIILTAYWEDRENCNLRGEMISVGEDRWIFVGFPPVSSFADLQARGFTLSDLPLNSGVGDSIIAIESAQVSLHQTQKALEELERSHNVLSELNQVFGRFVPGAFLESIGLKSPALAQLGDHASTKVSIMFADLRGFTTMSERMSSRQIFSFLNRFLAFVAPNIRNNGGFVVHYTGDGFLALFPGEMGNSVRASVEMQRSLIDAMAVGGLGEFVEETNPPRLGVGLSYGPVEMGIIGESGRWDPAVISDSVNVSARLQEHTKLLGAQILLTSELATGMHNPQAFHMRRVGQIELRGRSERVEIFEVLDGLPLAERTLRILNRKIFEAAIHEFERGDSARSKETLRKYLQICPNDSAALYYLGL